MYPAILFFVAQPSWLWGGQASCLTNLRNPAGETPAVPTGPPRRIRPVAN